MNQLDKIWDEAIKEWSKQGRTEEQVWAVRNFMTGTGVKAKARIKDLMLELYEQSKGKTITIPDQDQRFRQKVSEL